jgi:GT2 family glycosyltransferase
MKKTAIILITKNRLKLLQQTVATLIKNTPKELYDLIVVDDGSEPQCVSYLQGLKIGGVISDLVLTNLGSPSKCRNIGAEIVKKKGYKFLYHTDNDMYFLPEWLEECHKAKDNSFNIIIVGAYCHPFMQANEEKTLFLDTPNNIREDIATVDAVSGNSWFISTEDYFKYGLHETDGIMASEDWEMCQRIRKDGNFVVRLTPHKVLHCGITNSRNEPSVGADIILEELSQAKINYNLDIYYE